MNNLFSQSYELSELWWYRYLNLKIEKSLKMRKNMCVYYVCMLCVYGERQNKVVIGCLVKKHVS